MNIEMRIVEMNKIDEYIKKKSEESTEWQKEFEIEYKKLLDSLNDTPSENLDSFRKTDS